MAGGAGSDVAEIIGTWLESFAQLSFTPDLVPYDVHLFRSLHNPLNGQISSSEDDVRVQVEMFFITRDRINLQDGRRY